MNQNKKGSPNQHLSCEICDIESMSNAEYALHEFTKKHCDNLVRLAKNKPILKKQKTKNKISEVEKETVKVNTVTHTGSFAKYGYFIPGEIYAAAKEPKEFNIDYDPYLQKFADRSLKEQPMPLPVEQFEQQHTSVLASVTPTTRKKKKKKSNIKTCQICNVTLLTVPAYEAHMKSPEHIWKLKVSGMGVSAHFVKASSDLHTTETKEDQKVSEESIIADDDTVTQSCVPEPSLYCNVCELLLNSQQQYTAHICGKYHTDYLKKKIEQEKEMQSPPSDQLFCYSCNILLNTVFQYNEHKNGKKHKTKCRALIRKGMTVPPEERVPGIGIPNCDLSQPVYPELYVKMILERQKKSVTTTSSSIQGALEMSDHNVTSISVKETTSTDIQEGVSLSSKALDNGSDHELVKTPNITFHKINFVPATSNETTVLESVSENDIASAGEVFIKKTAEDENINKDPKSNSAVLNIVQSLHCSICDENFQWQVQFDTHLTLEDHFKNIVQMKMSGKSDNEILNLIFSDRNVIKPNNSGKLTCSICKVTADSASEFEQHLSSVVHKYTEKDYKQKRTIEVKNMIPSDESGMYYCKLCKVGWTSLVEFNQHLFTAKHKSIQKKRKTSKCTSLSQRQRFSQNLKRKYILLQSLKADKNPGIRTKISGLATDLQTGAQSKVPNLELLEPKIEPTKNVKIGISEKSDVADSKNKNLKKPNVKPRRNFYKKVQGLNQSNSGPVPPPLLSANFLPSVNFPRYPNRPPFGRLPFPPTVRNVPSFYNSYPPAFRPFHPRPIENPFYRPPCFRRPPWCDYR